jgi:hypothetical protein
MEWERWTVEEYKSEATLKMSTNTSPVISFSLWYKYVLAYESCAAAVGIADRSCLGSTHTPETLLTLSNAQVEASIRR